MEEVRRSRKVLIICGSGQDGSTADMCDAASAVLSEEGFIPVTLMPIAMDIVHCTGCQRCSGGVGCIIEDDMCEIYDLFAECDGIVLASPLRFSGPSSVIKTVMDRMQVYWGSPGIPRPRWMMLLSCSGSESPDFSHLRSIMRAFSITLGMEWIGEVYVTGTDGGRDHVRESARDGVRRLMPIGTG